MRLFFKISSIACLGVVGGLLASFFAPVEMSKSFFAAITRVTPVENAPGFQPGTLRIGRAAANQFKFGSPFFVPLIQEDTVRAIIAISLGLELQSGSENDLRATEVKLRDRFLQVLFDHASLGGFQGDFTSTRNLLILKTRLLDSAQQSVGTYIIDVFITDIARQKV